MAARIIGRLSAGTDSGFEVAGSTDRAVGLTKTKGNSTDETSGIRRTRTAEGWCDGKGLPAKVRSARLEALHEFPQDYASHAR